MWKNNKIKNLIIQFLVFQKPPIPTNPSNYLSGYKAKSNAIQTPYHTLNQ